jgi:replicative DNA helicase
MIEDRIPLLRVPPHSLEAEQSVLGGLLLDNEAIHRVSLVPEAFYSSDNAEIYRAIQALSAARKPFDPITVYDQLGDKGEAVGGLAYLNSLAQFVPSASAIARYAEIVLERWQLRQLVTAGDEISAMGFEPAAPAEQINRAQALLSKLVQDAPRDEWIGAYEGMVNHSQILERRASGELTAWSTGLADLDDYLEGGLRPGELVIVGARPSMGKTALGLTIGVHMASERPVALLSMEMSHLEVNDRLTAMLGCVSMSAVKRPQRGSGLAWDRVVDGTEKAKGLRLVVSDQGGLNLNQVRSKARNAKRAHGLEVLIVDYIGLMSGLNQKDNRNTQLGEISRGLKTLAKELQISVLCLAQLNRKAEERSDQMPQMSDLRDSGEIEQDADVIIFIKRPIVANPDLGLEWQHYAKVSIAKNRQGRCGVFNLSYMGEQTRFGLWGGPAPQKPQPESKSRGMQA